MMEKRKNFSLTNIGPLNDSNRGKYFAGSDLGLTGSEVSINVLQAGKGASFTHAHKKNEELYIVINGNGIFFIDGEEYSIKEGSLIRVAPNGDRAIKAGSEDLIYICMQAQEGSLTQAAREDGILLQTKSSWMNELD